MIQTVTPGYVPAMRRWFWCVCASGSPTKLLFETCRHAAHSAAARAGRDGGEVRRRVFERFDGDIGGRVLGADLL